MISISSWLKMKSCRKDFFYKTSGLVYLGISLSEAGSEIFKFCEEWILFGENKGRLAQGSKKPAYETRRTVKPTYPVSMNISIGMVVPS